MSYSAGDGTKVTSDPESLANPKNENPGMVTSDSLAAESIQGGGSFAANSDARGPMDQPSYSTNTNTTDTSSATRLDPALDAEARQASEEWSENAQLNAGSQLGTSEIGMGSTYGGGGGSSTTADGSDESGLSSYAGNASMPKGQNLQEGGFSSEDPNASYTTDIGGKDDPGRVALGRMEASNTPYAGGVGGRQDQVSGDGQYDSLDETSA